MVAPFSAPRRIYTRPAVRRTVLVALCAVSSLLALSGCGESEADQRLRQAEEVQRATQEAAREARLEERERQQRRDQARLEREIERLKRDRGSAGAPTGSGGAPPPPPSASASCGGGLSVGPNTSCSFARNVRSAYFESGGSSRVTVYSPTTGRNYVMSCSGGSPHVCTGGNNASVYFP